MQLLPVTDLAVWEAWVTGVPKAWAPLLDCESGLLLPEHRSEMCKCVCITSGIESNIFFFFFFLWSQHLSSF